MRGGGHTPPELMPHPWLLEGRRKPGRAASSLGLPGGGAEGARRVWRGGVRTYSLEEGNRDRKQPPPTSGRNVAGVGQAQRTWGYRS